MTDEKKLDEDRKAQLEHRLGFCFRGGQTT